MIVLHRLHIQNFLSLRDVEVELGDLTVLVGPHAAGKSNLLKVFEFLGETARTDLVPAVNRFGGVDALLFRGKRRKAVFSIELHAEVTRYAHGSALDEYRLQVRPRGSVIMGPLLEREESFRFKRTRGAGRRITLKGGRLAVLGDDDASLYESDLQLESVGLSVLRKLGKQVQADQWQELASLFLELRIFDPDVSVARLPVERDPSPVLASDASNLAAFLEWLSEEHADTFDVLVDDLRTIVPSVEALEFRPVGGSTEAVALGLRERHLSGITDLAHASYGTVRALALLAMLHDPNPPRLTLVEEIDHGLHPWALDRIVERLRSATRRTQLLLATHSPALVNRLRPEEIIVCERDPKTGASLIPAIDAARVRELVAEDELSLGELWFTGTLGGVPE